MGWVVGTVCNRKNQSQKLLVIELSSSDIEGEKVVKSFIEYIKSKDATINFSLIKNETMNKCIIIRYICFNIKKIVYNGYDLNEQLFETIYRSMIILED